MKSLTYSEWLEQKEREQPTWVCRDCASQFDESPEQADEYPYPMICSNCGGRAIEYSYDQMQEMIKDQKWERD